MRQKYKKAIAVTTGIILIIMVASILFISPIATYLIEKYDEKYTGRKIEIGRTYINPFTGYVYLSNLKLYELKSDSIFFSANSISANIDMMKLAGKTYEISEFTLNQPKGIIIQTKKTFNFDDLLKLFVPKNPDSTKTSVRFNILKIKINQGEFHFRDKLIPINYFIKHVNFESSGIRWNADTIAASFSFLSGPGSGDIKGHGTFNIHNMDYRLAAVVNKFDLNFLEQYFKDISNYGSFSANMDADVKITGNVNDKKNITVAGILAINDFHFGKNANDDYASFDKFFVSIKKMSPKSHAYYYDSISLSHPYFKYERYDTLDNIQTMFGKSASNVTDAAADQDKFNLIIEIARYVKVLAGNFFQSNYNINHASVYNAHIKFNDYSVSEKFSIGLNSLYAHADSIDKSRDRVEVFLKSKISPYGNASLNLSINPKDSSDFQMKYHIGKLPSTIFNPYIISYTSYALDRGTMEFHGNWTVKNGIIKSNNHLLIIDPRATKRIRNKDSKWIPMPLIMSVIRDRGNVIDYEIPITGDLKNPKFNLRDVILDLLENIFVKPPTTPYRIEVKNVETKIEKSITLKWDMRQHILLPEQEKFIDRIADFLINNPESSLNIYPKGYAVKEKEHIVFFEAKKKYFLLSSHRNSSSFNKEDSMLVDKMSVKDPVFIRYMNKQLNDSMMFTVQEKCSEFIGKDIIKSKLIQLYKERENNFLLHFKKTNVDQRVKIHANEDVIPYNGFSFYNIDYTGSLPESLLKAYKKMNELDDEVPRKEYRKERKKNKNAF